MMSMTGCMPVIAAPTPMPVMPGLGDRGVDDPLRAELLDESSEHFEWRAGLGNILANDEHGGIAAQLFGEGFANGLGEGDFTCSGGSGLAHGGARRRHVGQPHSHRGTAR